MKMKVITDEQCNIVDNLQSTKIDNEIQQLVISHEENNVNCENNDDNNNRLSSNCLTYPGLSEILPGFYLCGASVARPDILENLGVTFVINAAPELPDTPLPDSNPMYLQVPVMDHPDVDLSAYFDEVADLIEDVRLSDGKTLVHCVAGVSRSASLCLVYLMKYMKMTLREAFFHIRSIRPQIRPNMGFFRQLIAYEESIYGESTVKWIYYESIQREVPDVYEKEYRNTELFYQKYRQNIKRR